MARPQRDIPLVDFGGKDMETPENTAEWREVGPCFRKMF
jgi:hypothetical protein